MHPLQRNTFLTCKQTYHLLCSVDEEEPSAVMVVKPDKVMSWLVVVSWLLLWELSALKVTLLQLPPSLDASFAEHEIYWRETSKGTLNGNLLKNLPTQIMRDWRGKPDDQWEHPSPVEKLMSLKGGSCHWWKISQPSYRRLRRKIGQGNQSMKNFLTDDEDLQGKPKDHKV